MKVGNVLLLKAEKLGLSTVFFFSIEKGDRQYDNSHKTHLVMKFPDLDSASSEKCHYISQYLTLFDLTDF